MAFKRTALALAIPLILVGCGGDDSPDIPQVAPPAPPPVTPVEPAFFYNGDLTEETSLRGEIPTGIYRVALSELDTSSDSDRVETLGTAFISDTGRIAFALDDDNRVAFARIALDAQKTFEAALLDTDNQFDEGVLVRGSRDRLSGSDSVRVSGTLVGADNGTLLGTYQLDKQAQDGSTTSLSNVAGTYRSTFSGITLVLTLSEDGMLTGSDTSGCQFAGEAVIPNSRENVIEMRFEASGCGPTATVTAPQRNGAYFGLASLDRVQSTLLLLAGNEDVGLRFAGRDVDEPIVVAPEPVGPPVFVSANLDNDISVESRLNPGVYQYVDITPQDPPEPGDMLPAPDSGDAYLSSTGRLVFVTDYRTLGARVTVSDVSTFRSPASERLEPIPEDEDRDLEPSTLVEVFGTPDTSSGGADQVVGSLLNQGQLRNRFRLTRDDSASDVGLSDSDIAGIYLKSQAGGFNTTLNIIQGSGDGPGMATLTGSDTTGCIYNGEVKIPDPSINVVEMRFTLGGTCSPSPEFPTTDRSGTYNAVGTLDKTGPSDQLTIVMISEDNVLRFSGTKQ